MASVISALGGTTAFAVSDKAGQFSSEAAAARAVPGSRAIARLPRRAQHHGQRAARRRAARRRSRCAAKAPPARRGHRSGDGRHRNRRGRRRRPTRGDRDESELAWRLRHLKRGVLARRRHAGRASRQDDDWFIADSIRVPRPRRRHVGPSGDGAVRATSRSTARSTC